MSGELAGRIALVTGASSGLGRAIALDLAQAGAAVALTARSEAPITATATAIQSAGGRAVAIPADVTDAASVARLVESVTAQLGTPELLVNNAGAAESHKLAGHPDALWDRMLAVNLTGPYLVTKACAPAMLGANWGRVVNIGSIASLTGGRYIVAYSAAKHGLLGLTRALAAEWARTGITVNLVAPGYVDTPMTDASVANIVARTGRDEATARAAILALSPQHRLVTVEEIVPVVRLLLTDASASITGAVIPIDAGASAFAATG